MQTTNLVFFILPNAYILRGDCAWFNTLVTWAAAVRWQVRPSRPAHPRGLGSQPILVLSQVHGTH